MGLSKKQDGGGGTGSADGAGTCCLGPHSSRGCLLNPVVQCRRAARSRQAGAGPEGETRGSLLCSGLLAGRLCRAGREERQTLLLAQDKGPKTLRIKGTSHSITSQSPRPCSPHLLSPTSRGTKDPVAGLPDSYPLSSGPSPGNSVSAMAALSPGSKTTRKFLRGPNNRSALPTFPYICLKWAG